MPTTRSEGRSAPQPPVPSWETFPSISTCCPYREVQPSHTQPRAAPRKTRRVPLCIYTDSPAASVWRKRQQRNYSFLEKQSMPARVSALCTSFCKQTDQVSILLALRPTSCVSMTSDFTFLSLSFFTCKMNLIIPTFQHWWQDSIRYGVVSKKTLRVMNRQLTKRKSKWLVTLKDVSYSSQGNAHKARCPFLPIRLARI